MSRSITIEDLYKFKFLGSPRISPDGQCVAFTVTTINERKHVYESSLWVISIEGGEAKRLTGSTGNAHSPSWSPDGRWLAFLSDRETDTLNNTEKEQRKLGKGKAQVWLLPTDGGEAHQLTFMPHGAFNPVWSPDSQKLIFSAMVGPLDEVTEDDKPLPKARVIDRLYYRRDGTGYIYDRRQHLFLMNINDKQQRQLTDGDWDDKDPAWSPDGTRIAFISSRAEDRWRLPSPDIYIMSLTDGPAQTRLDNVAPIGSTNAASAASALYSGGTQGVATRLPFGSAVTQGVAEEPRCLTDGTRSCSSPSWSPDGKTLAFLAAQKFRSGGQVELFTITTDTGSIRCLTGEFEGSCSDWTNSDMTDEHVMPPPPWSNDGKTLYVLAAERGASRVYAISSEGSGKHPPTLTPGNIHVLDFRVDLARNKLVTLVENPTRIAEIYASTISSPGELRQLTHFNTDLFKELTLATPEYMPYTGAEGWPVDGWLLKPQKFDPARKYPLIVEIHGGPNTQYGYGFMHEMQMLAAAGYVVLFTNPRGSLGYGRNFALAVRGAWGEKDSLDILAGVDVVLQKGFIDEQKMGVIGGSYGGFMTNWLIGHTDRFKVAVSDRSVIDRFSFFGTSDIGWEFTDDDLEIAPWDDPQPYIHVSPITYVKQMHTPLLIIHSENDLRCNIEQSEQLFAALKYLGREVLFVRFEGQSHSLSRGGHPRLRVERLKQIQRWFEKYL